MSNNLYVKPDGCDGYYMKTVPNISTIDIDKTDCCKSCAHCGQLINLHVCTSKNAVDILIHSVDIVAPNGYCNKYNRYNTAKKYSMAKALVLKIRGIQRDFDR